MLTAAIDVKVITSTYLIPWGIKIVAALVIFIIGRWVAKFIVRMLKRMMAKGNVDKTLTDFLSNIIYTLLIVVVIMAALDQLGVKTTSALAILGAAGLAIGLALQNSLTNFASGVMLILFRPFKIGDFVEAGGTKGIVEAITIFSTMMRTPDNREVTIPNAQIHKGTIINYSARSTRRIDMIFGIGYDDDIRKAKELINQTIISDIRILKDPEPVILVDELGDSCIKLAVRPWVKSDDYFPVRSDLLEKVKLQFDANGISIPYPQQDVHLVDVPAAMKG